MQLQELDRSEEILTDGHRRCLTGAMEEMDLVVRPQPHLQSITVKPESPNISLSMAMRPGREAERGGPPRFHGFSDSLLVPS